MSHTTRSTLIVACLSLCIMSVLPLVTTAQENQDEQERQGVILLETLPQAGITAGEEAPDLGNYLNGLFRLGIGIATGLAVIMIVIGGIEYMGSESVFKKEGGREKIRDALFGLLLAIAAFLILFTINPALTRFDLLETIEEVKNRLESLPGRLPSGPCPNCVTTSNLPTKPGICGGGACQLEEGFVESLQQFDNDLFVAGVPWQITEGYPPTTTHRNVCHQNGTCIDANFPPGTPVLASNIQRIVDAADNNTLTACYEVRTSGERNDLIDQGVAGDHVKVIPDRPDGSPGITAPHFSIYGYRTSC